MRKKYVTASTIKTNNPVKEKNSDAFVWSYPNGLLREKNIKKSC